MRTQELEQEIRRQREMIAAYRDAFSSREQVDRMKRALDSARLQRDDAKAEAAELAGTLAAVEAILTAERRVHRAEVRGLREQLAQLEARIPRVQENAQGMPIACLRCAAAKTGAYFCDTCWCEMDLTEKWRLLSAWDDGERDFPRPRPAA